MPTTEQPKSGNDLIIPREFSKNKEQIANLQAKKSAAEKDPAKGPAKREMADLKKEVEMTVHLKTPYNGLVEIANDMGFTPTSTIAEHLKNGLTTEKVDVRSPPTCTLVCSFCL